MIQRFHYTITIAHTQSSLAQLGIPLTDVVKVLVATLLLGNVLFYEAKNQELSMQGVEGQSTTLVAYEILVASICAELEAVAALLGVEPSLLQQGLTLRTYHSDRGEEVRSQCSAAAVSDHTPNKISSHLWLFY